MINARRYSVYIKNVPPEKCSIGEIDTFFRQFGDVVKIDVHREKMAATIKFKEIESAEKAAHSTITLRQPIWGNQQVQLIYNIAG